MKVNKKISFFIPSLRGGGAERMFVNLANAFSEKGFNVSLILAQKEGPYLSLINEKVNVVDLGASRVLFSLFPLVKYLRKENPDYLLSTLNHANIVAVMAKIFSFSKTKLIIRVPNYISISANVKEKIFAKVFYKKADKIIAISKGIKNDLVSTLGLSADKIEVIYNPVFEYSILEKFKENIDHPYFKSEKNKIFLGVGRLTYQKDFETLLRAFSKINKKLKNTKLIILGEGEDREKLQELIIERGLKNDVSIPGFADNPYAYMAKSDVFVLSSRFEGFGNVIVEAMACGTSVVSTDCPSGPREILEDGKFGKLVSVGDYKEMAKAIEETLENSMDSKILQKRAKDFDIEKISEKYLSLMK